MAIRKPQLDGSIVAAHGTHQSACKTVVISMVCAHLSDHTAPQWFEPPLIHHQTHNRSNQQHKGYHKVHRRHYGTIFSVFYSIILNSFLNLAKSIVLYLCQAQSLLYPHRCLD